MIYKTSLRAAVVGAFLFTSALIKAQPVVTEYFQVSETFTIDMKDKKTRDIIFTKGVVDAEWQSEKRTFAISYNPYQTDIDAAIKSVKDKVGAALLTSKNRLFTSLTRF
jgi:viroplasmin and RNaseH domain-containing protein